MRVADRLSASGDRHDCGPRGHIVLEVGPAGAGVMKVRSGFRPRMLHRYKQAAVIGGETGAAQFRPARGAQEVSGQCAAGPFDITGP